jgi:hypothetical protein
MSFSYIWQIMKCYYLSQIFRYSGAKTEDFLRSCRLFAVLKLENAFIGTEVLFLG